MYNVILRRVRKLWLSWKSNKYYICVCACARPCVCPDSLACAYSCVHVILLIQHATRIAASFLAPLAPSLFSILSHKRHDYRKNVIKHKICVLISSTILSKTFPILRIIQADIVINVKTSSSKVPVILV
jgi:hypothetical protein